MIWMALVVPALIQHEIKPTATPVSSATKAGVTVELLSVQKFSTKQALIRTGISGPERARYSTIVVALQGETSAGEWFELQRIELDASKMGGEWAESFEPSVWQRWVGGVRLEIVGLEQSPEQVRLEAIAKEIASRPKERQAARAKSSRYAFKEFQLGMYLKELTRARENFREDGYVANDVISDSIAGVECLVYLKFEDYGKSTSPDPGNRLQLDYINVTADKSAFSTILDALKQKFGAPVSSRAVTKSNAMGATFHGREVIWSNGNSILKAEELGSKIDECCISWIAKGLGKSLATKASKDKAAADL